MIKKIGRLWNIDIKLPFLRVYMNIQFKNKYGDGELIIGAADLFGKRIITI